MQKYTSDPTKDEIRGCDVIGYDKKKCLTAP